MYKCDKCICSKCKNNGLNDGGIYGECDYCSMCTLSISDDMPSNDCDEFVEIVLL